MALTVNTNMASFNAIRNLNATQGNLSKAFGRISSGMRVTSASDDAAGLAVAENLDAATRSLDAALRNANDGMSVIQVAEGASGEVSEMLKRMRELAVQSSSETLDSQERAYIQLEVDALVGEIDRLASVTNFNGVQLADGTNAALDVQVGIQNSANDLITVSLGDLRATALGVNGLDVDDATNAQASIDTLDNAIDSVNAYRASYGAVQNRIDSAMTNSQVYQENLEAAKSRILDADFATETANLAKYQIMQQAGVAILGQANQMTQGATQLLG